DLRVGHARLERDEGWGHADAAAIRPVAAGAGLGEDGLPGGGRIARVALALVIADDRDLRDPAVGGDVEPAGRDVDRGPGPFRPAAGSDEGVGTPTRCGM